MDLNETTMTLEEFDYLERITHPTDFNDFDYSYENRNGDIVYLKTNETEEK